MADSRGTDPSDPAPRKGLSRLRAQRNARKQGGLSDAESAVGDGSDVGSNDRNYGQAAPLEPNSTSGIVPGQRRTHPGRAAPVVGSSRAGPNLEERLARRDADRNRAIQSISPDDLDKTALILTDASQFLGFRFQDSTDLFPMAFPSKFDPELGKVGERIVFVENAETGLMEPKGAGYSTQVAIDDDDLDEDSHLLGKLDGSFPGEEDPLYGWGTSVGHREGRDASVTENVQLALSHGSVTMMIRCIYVCAQGILAGFSFLTVYNLTSFDKDEDFIMNYQPSANEVRRFFYLLSTISLAGGLDACLDVFAPSSTDIMAIIEGPVGSEAVIGSRNYTKSVDGKSGSQSEHVTTYASTADRPTGAIPMYGLRKAQGGPIILVSLMCVMYVVCLICTLIMAPQDVLIYNKNDESGDSWALLALDDSNFKDGLDTWKSLAAVRLICALAAWVIVCVLTWSNLAVSLRLIDLVVRLRQMIARRKNRIHELEGDGDLLTALSDARLRELIETQRVGLQRAEDELRNRVGFSSEA